jgi:hypothetical protein
MKLLKKYLSLLLIYKILALFKWTYTYIKDYEYVSDTLYSHQFASVLKKYLGVSFKKDWLGRIYGVINPNIDIKGNLNFDNVVIELDDLNSNNNTYVSQWVYRQLSMVQALYKLENSGFFDLVGVEFKHVGPINQDNYLVIFDIVSRKEMSILFKSIMIRLFIYSIIIILFVYTAFII